jgi:hypothetical protein
MATRAKPKQRPVLTPRELGAERRRLAKRRESELAHREREYKRVFVGSLAPAAAGEDCRSQEGGAAAAAGHAGRGCEAAPRSSPRATPGSTTRRTLGGIIPRLSARLGIPILSLRATKSAMLGVEGAGAEEHLINGGPGGTPWDVLLFSGGGNDIVDNPMALWVRAHAPGKSPQQLIHQPRFDAALALVRAGYEDLIALRDAHSPTTRLVFHTYDFALPSGDASASSGLGPADSSCAVSARPAPDAAPSFAR